MPRTRQHTPPSTRKLLREVKALRREQDILREKIRILEGGANRGSS